MSFRNKFNNRRKFLSTPMDQNKKTGIIFYGISILVHVVFFSGVLFFQNFQLPKPMPPVIQIDLVSFTPEPDIPDMQTQRTGQKDAASKEGIPVTVKTLKKKSRKISNIKPDISLKTKPKNLKDLMAQQEKKEEPEKKPPKKEKSVQKRKQKVDPSKALEDARQKLEKTVEDQTRDKIAQALSRLQGKVKEQGKIKETERPYAGYGKKGYKPIDLYQMVLGSAIEQNWVFNEVFARMDQNLEVRILIKILKNGEIRDIIYETRSGNRYLDESAKKAIKKASPLPALPPGMYSYDLLIGFTPKGLK